MFINAYKRLFNMNFNNLFAKLKNFLMESKRVFLITKKPTKQEFKIIVKVSAIGMLLIGFVGFLITLISKLVF